MGRYLSAPEHSFTSLRELKIILDEQFNLDSEELSVTTIFRMVKLLKFGYKRCKIESLPRNQPATKESRYKLIMEILRNFDLNRTFIYIDESGFNTTTRPLYGYAQNSKPCVYKVGRKGKNISLLAAMTEKEVLGYQIFKGSVSAQDYGTFIINLIRANGLQEKNLDNYVFFVDNARIHKAKKLSLLNNNLNICFNAPYSPQLNPIEGLFSLWKSNFRSMRSNSEIDVMKNIILSGNRIKTRHLLGFTKKSVEYYFDCLEKNYII